MSEFEIKPATRTGIKPLIGLYGLSGGGKTRSALILARGIAGPKGRIVLIDTENGRGQIFADKIDGGYGVIPLAAPFSPARYKDAIAAAEQNADVIVIDSMTHAWDGEGGVLDMHEAELDRMCQGQDGKRESKNFPAWRQPKIEYGYMFQAIMRCRVPLICCLRAKEKTRIVKEQGRTTVQTDQYPSPIFDDKFIFEMLINGETYQREGKGGYLRITKCTHEDTLSCLPRDGEQITYEHGRKLAAWCASGTAPVAESKPSTGAKDVKAALKKELFALTKSRHLGDVKFMRQWLVDEMCLDPGIPLEDLNEQQLTAVIAAARKKIKQ